MMLTRLRPLLLGLVAVALCVPTAAAQEIPAHNLDSFKAVDLPAPNAYRSGDGRPGAEYWQQEADYTIDVTLNPETNTLSGSESITYTNNAPQALHYLWVQLDQNLFKPDSRGASVVPSDARFSGFFADGGYTIENVQLQRDGDTTAPQVVIDGTRMRIPLDEPLAANGGTLTLSLDFSFTIPKYGADRHGRLDVEQGTVYELAQWYPRMYVYDDVHGWNPLPYLGQGEYYLEYGDFDYAITAPREYTVTGSGVLQNPEDVLTDTQRDRLDDARESRETVTIIGQDEVGTEAVVPDGEGPLTWEFTAENVRDVAWAASDAFIWDAAKADAGTHNVLAQSFYPKEGIGQNGNPGWEESTRYVQHSVEFYSDTYSPYPYPSAVNVAGIVGGMEYPQIMFCSVEARGRGLFGVTDHEFGHTWFPMVVGSDERRWAWMDEGLNSFMNVYSTDAFYDENGQQSLQRLSRRTASVMRTAFGDQPIMTQSDHLRRRALGFLAYRKPANGLMLLREVIVGPELFDEAFQTYIDRWAYKHPKPADFFRTLEDVSGEKLDWFWRSWFYETDVLDQAVARVSPADSAGTTYITVEQREDLMLPVLVEVTFADGSTASRTIPAEAFFTSDRHQFGIETDQPVESVVLDPNRLLPDVNRGNNTWTASDASSDAEASQDEASGQ